MTEDKRQMNPDIKVLNIGVKQLRSVHFYPLSMSDQFKLTETLANVINDMGNNIDMNNASIMEALSFVRDVISQNLETILTYVTTEEERPSIDEITNNQFYEIVDAIFTVNYEGILKNSSNLIERVRTQINQIKK